MLTGVTYSSICLSMSSLLRFKDSRADLVCAIAISQSVIPITVNPYQQIEEAHFELNREDYGL